MILQPKVGGLVCLRANQIRTPAFSGATKDVLKMSATIASNAAAVRSSLKPAELVASRGQLHSLYGTDTSQHIYYIGADNHVHELYAEPGAGWRDNDRTGSTGAPLPVMGTPITGFWGTDKSEHMHFIGVDGNVH